MIRKLKNIYHRMRAIIAMIYFRFPARNLKVLGITGTDGKTTTCFYLYNILLAAGKKVALITTIEARFGEKSVDVGLHVTNPDTWEMQKLLRQIANAGMEYAVLEVTSHGIDQGRIFGIPFVVTGLTNITHEHLDYHKTMEEYTRVKMGFVMSAPKHFIADEVNDQILNGVKINLPGEYNQKNAQLAAAMASSLGVANDAIRTGIESLKYLPGRMEVITETPFNVIVDFAHTPNGLENVLKSVRSDVNNRGGQLIHVFGSAGERDFTKRPIMGKISGEIADVVIVTAEDPRHERVDDISSAIAQGVESTGKQLNDTYFMINDREAAIKFALTKLEKQNDTVLITGKGHERSMNIDGVEQPWSDQETVHKVINSKET